MVESLFILLLTITSLVVFAFCVVEIVIAFKDFSYEKYMRHRRKNKKNNK